MISRIFHFKIKYKTKSKERKHLENPGNGSKTRRKFQMVIFRSH